MFKVLMQCTLAILGAAKNSPSFKVQPILHFQLNSHKSSQLHTQSFLLIVQKMTKLRYKLSYAILSIISEVNIGIFTASSHIGPAWRCQFLHTITMAGTVGWFCHQDIAFTYLVVQLSSSLSTKSA